jgi:hypothetical protein
LPSFTVTPLQGIRAAAFDIFGLREEHVQYAIGAPTFRFIPLLSRYLWVDGQQGGLVEFFNGPFEQDGKQQGEAIHRTVTTSSQIILNDHIRE